MSGILGFLPQSREAVGLGRAVAWVRAPATVAASLIGLVCVLYADLGQKLLAAGAAMSLPALLIVVLGGLRAYRADRSRAATRARVLQALVDANRLFCLRPSEDAIRQHLADAIGELTRSGAVVSGADGRLAHRSGRASQWRGALEAELVELAGRAMDCPRAQTVARGVFRARTDSLNARVFGSAIWVQPAGSAAFTREIDHYVTMLIELASAAIVQSRKDVALSGRSFSDRFSGEGVAQARRFGLV